jgi:hypothetical protein
MRGSVTESLSVTDRDGPASFGQENYAVQAESDEELAWSVSSHVLVWLLMAHVVFEVYPCSIILSRTAYDTVLHSQQKRKKYGSAWGNAEVHILSKQDSLRII